MIVIGNGGNDEINSNPQPTKQELDEIAAIGRELYKKLLQTDTETILDHYNEVYIRKAARLAGLTHVTDFIPKRVDWNFVEEVKEVVRRKGKSKK